MRKIIWPWTCVLLAGLNAHCAKPSFAPDGILLPTNQGEVDASFLAGMSASDIWGVGGIGFSHWNGKAWSMLPAVNGWDNAAPDANAVWLGEGAGVGGPPGVANHGLPGQSGSASWQSGMELLARLGADGTTQDFTQDFSPTEGSFYQVIPRVFASGTIAVFQSTTSVSEPPVAPIVYQLQSGHFVAGELLPQGFVFLWAGSPDDVWGFSDSTMSGLLHDAGGTLTTFPVPAIPVMPKNAASFGFQEPMMTSASDVWLPLTDNGSVSSAAVGHWDGSQWTWQSPPQAVPPAGYSESVLGYAPVSPGVLAVFTIVLLLEGQPRGPAQILARNWDGTSISYAHLIKWCPTPESLEPTQCQSAGSPDLLGDGTGVLPLLKLFLPMTPNEW